MIIIADAEGKKLIEDLVNAGMKAGAFGVGDIAPIARSLQQIKPFEERQKEEE